MSEMSLLEQVTVVQTLRERLAATKQQLAAYQADFNLCHAQLINGIAEHASALTEAEAELRRAVVTHYQDTGDKTPGYGLGVRMVRKVRYEAHKALEWAKEHKLFLIPESLDVKAFEKHCKDSKELPECAAVYTVTEATIPTDLGKVLAEQPAAAGEDIPFEVQA